MKKIVGLLVSVFLLSAMLFVVPGRLLSYNAADPMGIDPWLGYRYDSMGSGFSRGNLQLPLDEQRGWPYETGGGQRSFLSRGVAVYDGVMYTQYMPAIDQNHSEVLALDVETGEEIWQVQLEGSSAWSVAPFIDVENQILYVAVGRRGLFVKEGPNGRGTTIVYALSMEDDGDILWSTGIQGTYSGGMTYADGALYVKSIFFKNIEDGDFTIGQDGSMITKLDTDFDGEIAWEQELEGAWYFEWDSPPVVSDDIVYVTTANFKMGGNTISFGSPSTVYALDADSGFILWRNDGMTEDSRLGGGVSVDDRNVYFCFTEVLGQNANIKLFALEKETGFLEWDFTVSGITYWATPVYNDEYVFFMAQNGTLYAINKDTGRSAWTRSVGNLSHGSVVATTDKYVVASAHTATGNTITGSNVALFDLEARGRKVWDDKFDDRIGHVAIYGHYILVSGMKLIAAYKSQVPVLEIRPERAILGTIERNTLHQANINIQNRGRDGLEGTITVSDPEWLSVNPSSIDDKTREITITVDTKGLDLRDHRGSVYIESNGGNKTIPVTFNVVDTIPPEVEIFKDDFVVIDDEYYTNNPNYLLKGVTEPTAALYIQGKEAELDADGIFELMIELKEGRNEIEIDATDDVGNQKVSTFVLFLDSTPPRLVVTTPNYKLSTDPNDYIMGSCDDLKAKITINGEEVQMAPNGTFAKMVFLARGVNEFIVQATDRVGNVTEVKHYIVFPERKLVVLFIGRNTAEINGVPVQLDVPPRIINNRTMVPLRFVGEALGAEVEWEGTEQKITLTLFGKVVILRIGATTALVNDEPVMLDSSPTIIGGRTLVPIRFISESLGAGVAWEGTQQRITITFPAS